MNVVLAAMVVGTMFAIWLAFDPAELTGPAYIEEHQNAIRALNVTMPILGAICIVLTIAHGWLARSSPAAFYLLLAGAAFMIVAGLITRFANQPINARVITWTPSAPPPGWMEVRDAWWQWHVGRTFAGIAAFLCIVAASVNPNAFKARYLERE